MTLLGKIFTVLIFIMSLVFMSFAVWVYVTHRNWRELVMNKAATAELPLGLIEQLNQAKTKRQEKERELDDLNKTLALERAARKSTVGSLESRLAAVQDQLAAEMASHDKLKSDFREKVVVVKVNSDNVERLTKEVATLRDEIRKSQLERDEQFKRVVAFTDQVQQQQGEVLRLQERNIQMAKQVAEFRHLMNIHGIKETDTKIAPVVDGLVLAVSPQGLVEISLGSDDGIQPGHELEVYRATQGSAAYLGRIVIRRARPDRAVGEILKDYLKGPIQANDRVFTKVG